MVLRKFWIWFTAGNQNFTKVIIRKNNEQFLPSPYSQAGGADYYSGDDVAFPPIRVDAKLKKSDVFEVFYQNSDGNAHTVGVHYELESVKQKRAAAMRETKERRSLTTVLQNLLNMFQKKSGLPETKVAKKDKDYVPDEPAHGAYYNYDKNNPPERGTDRL